MLLIIEDNTLEGQLLGIMLQQQCLPSGEPLRYTIMPTGADALAWLNHQPQGSVKAIILDRHLKQREDGLTLIPQLRAALALAENSVIIVRSIADDPQSVADAQRAQADAFVSKSRRVSTARLLELLDQLWQPPASAPRPWIAITT